MKAGNSAREVALLTLCACERQGGWSDGLLKKNIREANLDSRDAALATKLCFGVQQNRMLCDFYINHFSTVKTGKMEDRVLAALRLGVFQLLFLDKIPASAAVNESVNLTRRYGKNPRAAGLVNGVLRAVSRNRDTLPPAPDLATRYSHPQWLVDLFSGQLPVAEVEALLAADNEEPGIMVQWNRTQCTLEQLCASLKESSVQVESHPWLPGCLILSGTGNVERLEAFQKGWFYVQDAAARLSILAANPQPGMKVLDSCAAPGGKSFAAAIAMENRGEITSCDIHPHKKGLIEAGAARLGLSIIRAETQNSTQFCPDFEKRFDLVIADVPCSGLGVIRKKPDIRYKDPAPLEGLPAVQQEILNTVSCYVKPGGVLLYSTCTLLERENGGAVASFLARHKEFELEAFPLPGPAGHCDGQVTLWPHRHGTDGFFIAKMRRCL